MIGKTGVSYKYLIGILFLLVVLVFSVRALPTFDPEPTSKNLTEDTLFTLYVNASDNEPGMNSTLIYGSIQYNSTNDTVTLFSISTVAGDPSYGFINFTPVQDDVGNYTIIFIVFNANYSLNVTTNALTYTVIEVNDAPNISGIPNQTINEDETSRLVLDEIVDLWDYTSDEESNNSDLNFSISNQTSIALINCSIAYDRYVNCSSPTANQTGFTQITINVTDGNASDTGIFRINVTEVDDAPFFNVSNVINNVTWAEDTIGDINLSSHFYDVDSSDLDYMYTATSLTNITITIDNATGNVTLTPDANFTGVRYVRFRATDGTSWSAYSNNVTLNVTPVNDAPILNMEKNFTRIIGLRFFYNTSVNVTEVDEETVYYYSNSSIMAINETSGIINTTFVGENAGTYYINISVNDSVGSMDSQVVNLTLTTNTPPSFDNLPSALNATEDSEFWHDLNATDAEGDTFYFYDNTSLFDINETSGVINFTANNSEVGIYRVNISVNDTNGAINSSVVIFNVTNVNDAPQLLGNITISPWSEDTSTTVDILFTTSDGSHGFYDPDGDTLNLSATPVSNIAVTINHSTGLVTFTPDDNWYGIEYVIFNASDGINITQSNNITLNVTEVEEEVVTVTAPSGGGGGATQQMSINVYPQENLLISPNSEITSFFIIDNTGDVDFADLTLEAFSDILGMSLILDKTSFFIPKGETATTGVTLISKDIEPGTYSITFVTKSASKGFEQTINVYVDVSGDRMTRIQFVKDMFKENPECLELNELVTRAEEMIGLGNTGEATALLEIAIESCKDLISEKEEIIEKMGFFENRKIIIYGSIILGILVLLSISIGYFIREFGGSKKLEKEKWKFEVS